nr:sulfotransferase [uncultured Cohaesibacter sp.]
MTLSAEELITKGAQALTNGQWQAAEEAFSAILRTEPDHPGANHHMGRLAVAVGKPTQAIQFFGTALKQRPDLPQFWISYIDTLVALSMFPEAAAVLEQAKLHGIENEELTKLEALITGAPTSDATGASNGDKAASADLPQAAAVQLGQLLERKQFAEALEATGKLLPHFPGSIFLYNARGSALTHLDQHEEAIASFQKSLALNPNEASTHYNLALALLEMGDLDGARASFHDTLERNPHHIGAHHKLTPIKKFTEEDWQVKAMRSMLEGGELSDEGRFCLSFALSKAYEDLGKLDVALAYLHQGNDIRSRMLDYSIETDRALFDKIRTYHTRFIKEADFAAPAPAETVPIFILGMPRSGTSLVEQIISSHSTVGAAGELEQFGTLGNALISEQSRLTSETIDGFRDIFQTALQSQASGYALVTDKMPQNFRFINLIRTVYPEAKIIHVERDPVATCWSNYKHFFGNQGLGYSYNISDLIAYYDLYRGLMDYWNAEYPDQIYRLNYDRLVANQEAETRRLADFLALDWEEGLLSPQDNQRIVRTASQQQVRQSVYQDSSQQWRKFEPFLQGAFDPLLAYGLDD